MIASNIQLDQIKDVVEKERFDEILEIYNEIQNKYLSDYLAYDMARSMGMVFGSRDYNVIQLRFFKAIDQAINKVRAK